jgi:putative hemolysin
VFFVLTDVTPKSLFAYEADRWMYRLARVLGGAHALMRVVGLVPALKGISTLILRIARSGGGRANPFHPRQRLRAFLREGAAEGVITGYQHELVDKVLTLGDRKVRHAMIPLSRVTSVAVDTTRQGFIEHVRRHAHSRLPVWEDRRENIVGIVHITDVLGNHEGEAFDLRRVMGPALDVTPDVPVGKAMVRMQRARAAMAVVRDRKGRAAGIITMKDLVEEIVGELAVW